MERMCQGKCIRTSSLYLRHELNLSMCGLLKTYPSACEVSSVWRILSEFNKTCLIITHYWFTYASVGLAPSLRRLKGKLQLFGTISTSCVKNEGPYMNYFHLSCLPHCLCVHSNIDQLKILCVKQFQKYVICILYFMAFVEFPWTILLTFAQSFFAYLSSK